GLLILGTEKYVEKKLKSGKRGEESLKRVVDSLRLSGYKFLGYSVDPSGSGRTHMYLVCPHCNGAFHVREDHFTSDNSRCPRGCDPKNILYVVMWKDFKSNETALKYGITSKTMHDRSRKSGYGTDLVFIGVDSREYISEQVARSIESNIKKLTKSHAFESDNLKFKNKTELVNANAMSIVMAELNRCVESEIKK
ncbi:MAG: hypothetical protein ACRCWQ_14495, partial [Bacilli bacterium]